MLVFAVTLLAYWPALSAGFVWNDRDYVTKPVLRSLAGLVRIWTDVGATEQYYPFLHSAFWLEYCAWGSAAFGYHLINILLHAGSACLLARLLRRLAVPGAWLAALLFALHPVCVESVAWISEQKNTLSTFLYLATALAYLRFDGERTARRYALATGLFALALLTKSVTATLPAALLVIFWWQRGRLTWQRDVLPLIPWLAAGAVVGLFTGWVEKEIGGAKGADFQLTLVERGLVAGRAFWFYVGKLIWPANLIFIYPRWTVSAAAVWQYLYPAAALALVAVLWVVRRRWRAPLAAVLFFAGSLFPTLGFLNVYAFVYSYVADHWQYLASLGLITLTSAGIVVGLERIPSVCRRAGLALVSAMVVSLGMQTWQECRPYHDIESFYQTIIARNPACWMANHNLGIVLRTTGRAQEAIPHFEQALQANSDMPDAQTELALALQETGRGGEAVAHLEQALRLDPRYAPAHNALGALLAESGRLPEAIAHFNEALRIDPKLSDTHDNLGRALLAAGQPAEAIRHFETALRLNPDLLNAHNGLGMALLMTERPSEAIGQFEAVLRLNPNLPEVHMNLAAALESGGRSAEAAAQVEAARRLGFQMPMSPH